MSTRVFQPVDTAQDSSQNSRSAVAFRVSPRSLLPEGLLNTLTRDEILDLVAYIRSGGDPGHQAFDKK